MRFDQPLQPEAGADLFVGCGDEDEITRPAPAFARERRDRDGRRRNLPLHVERTATPDLVADELAAEGVARPFGRIRQHDVGVREERERRPVTASRDARDEIRPARLAGVERALDACGLEVVAQQLGGDRLVPGRVRRIEPDQPLQEVCDLRPGSHLRLPSTIRYLRGARIPPSSTR